MCIRDSPSPRERRRPSPPTPPAGTERTPYCTKKITIISDVPKPLSTPYILHESPHIVPFVRKPTHASAPHRLASPRLASAAPRRATPRSAEPLDRNVTRSSWSRCARDVSKLFPSNVLARSLARASPARRHPRTRGWDYRPDDRQSIRPERRLTIDSRLFSRAVYHR